MPVEAGLALLDFECYYVAAQLQWVARWLAGFSLHETGLSRIDFQIGLLHYARYPSTCSTVPTTGLFWVAPSCLARVGKLTVGHTPLYLWWTSQPLRAGYG